MLGSQNFILRYFSVQAREKASLIQLDINRLYLSGINEKVLIEY